MDPIDPSTPVVFLHAFPLNAHMWEPQLRALSPRKILTPDFPGFGGRPPGDPSLDAFAHAVLEGMDAADIQRAAVVGLSMGGYVAFRLLALAPHRVTALVLADTRAGPDDEAGREKRTRQAEQARTAGLDWLPEALLPALLGTTTLQERPNIVARVREMMTRAQAEGVALALEAMRDRPDSTPALATIRVPVLVLVGEEDTLTPIHESEKIVRGVEEGGMEVIPRAGHLANLEAPESFNDSLRTFLG